MVTKGYNSYHGRMSGGKIVLIVVLALVLVGAVAYLALQNYVVYDEAGNATIDLPFFHRKDDRDDKTDDSTVDGTGDRDDIVDTVVPEHPHVKVAALHGTRLPDDCLWWGADYIMNTLAPEDLVLAVKRTTGGITYATDVETPQGVVVETGRPIECLRTLLSSGRYTVGAHRVLPGQRLRPERAGNGAGPGGRAAVVRRGGAGLAGPHRPAGAAIHHRAGEGVRRAGL